MNFTNSTIVIWAISDKTQSTWYIPVIVILLGFIVYFVIRRIKMNKIKTQKTDLDKLTKIDGWVKRQYEKGYTKNDIMIKLRDLNWSHEDLNKIEHYLDKDEHKEINCKNSHEKVERELSEILKYTADEIRVAELAKELWIKEVNERMNKLNYGNKKDMKKVHK